MKFLKILIFIVNSCLIYWLFVLTNFIIPYGDVDSRIVSLHSLGFLIIFIIQILAILQFRNSNNYRYSLIIITGILLAALLFVGAHFYEVSQFTL